MALLFAEAGRVADAEGEITRSNVAGGFGTSSYLNPLEDPLSESVETYGCPSPLEALPEVPVQEADEYFWATISFGRGSPT